MSVSSDITSRIYAKKEQYCRGFDAVDWNLVENVFLPDAIIKVVDANHNALTDGGQEFSWANRDGFMTFFREYFKLLQSIHMVAPGEFEQVGPDEVKAICPLMYHIGRKDSETEGHGTGGGYYYETWKRKDGDWFISNMYTHRVYWRVHSQDPNGKA